MIKFVFTQKVPYIVNVNIKQEVKPNKTIKIMKNLDVCKVFVNGSKNGAHSLNMSISHDGSTLYSYNTAIAQKLPNGSIIVNETKYSVSTSKHQSFLRRAIPSELTTHHTTKHVPIGTYNLIKYVD